MPIVNSVITLNNLQADGTRNVIEDHEDHVGEFHRFSYSVPDGTDINALLVQHAAELEAQLPLDEEAANYTRLMDGEGVGSLLFNWNPATDEVKIVCVAFMQMDIETAIPLRPTVSGYTNAQIGAFFTAQERNRIQGHAGELLAIEAQISQWNDDKEVLLGIELGGP